jgi:hypothetical protein
VYVCQDNDSSSTSLDTTQEKEQTIIKKEHDESFCWMFYWSFGQNVYGWTL